MQCLIGIVLPTPGYEWLQRSMAGVVFPLCFAGVMLFRADKPMGTRDLLYKRLGALALVAISIFFFYLST